MRLRMTFLSLLAALLYVGPFLAGLANAPVAMLPVFAAVFMVWVMVMRPSVWAAATSKGAPAILAARLGILTLFQVLLVLVSFGMGRGLTILLDGTLAIPMWLPPVLSIIAIPLGRLVWTPVQDAAATDAFLDRAEAELTAQSNGR